MLWNEVCCKNAWKVHPYCTIVEKEIKKRYDMTQENLEQEEKELETGMEQDETSADADVNTSDAVAEDTPEAMLEKALAQVEEYKDKYLRQVAEFDNYRKRVMKEKAELIKNGGERVVTAILPIIDDFERARDNMDKMEDVNAVKEGVELIIEQFLNALKHEGVEKIDAVGQPFDVDYHEAIAMVPAPSDDMKGKVLDCVQTGYMLKDKVIRHAKVAVAK